MTRPPSLPRGSGMRGSARRRSHCRVPTAAGAVRRAAGAPDAPLGRRQHGAYDTATITSAVRAARARASSLRQVAGAVDGAETCVRWPSRAPSALQQRAVLTRLRIAITCRSEKRELSKDRRSLLAGLDCLPSVRLGRRRVPSRSSTRRRSGPRPASPPEMRAPARSVTGRARRQPRPRSPSLPPRARAGAAIPIATRRRLRND